MDYRNNSFCNGLLFQSDFTNTLTELQSINVNIPENPTNVQVDLQHLSFPPNGQLVTPIDQVNSHQLDPANGSKQLQKNRTIAAYDESMVKYTCLEGTAYLMSHSIVTTGIEDFHPTGLLTLYFYTRSKEITNKSKYLKYSSDPEMDSKKDYILDKIELLSEYTPQKSILLIDGPLIGGDVYTYMIRSIQRFLDKDIIPIYFVKNSNSNLVTDNIPEFYEKFNSDMHWAFPYLSQGERTNFFKYADKNNPDNAKVFCYLKGFNSSPQRVEFHVDTFNKYQTEISDLMDLIYYLLLVQGDLKNPQVRPIAIAERYAREFIRLTNINKYFNNSGLIPTINQERFGW
ncbi:hypothetical protein DRW41_05010 [Neobacillus piezotolerans]|uniref:NurA domain-containing protein n=1 Tax=Neobacillus piezotolerans TaxID=2259171 RepID=A0A3D8GWT3_9BACI|nr:DNA double-strand break repair nuclease NurA [Neobacillus piezotolerans]RDU38917.1 hypothetical protein DRW41_05010 [Neobacillus piezotolerans]